MPTGKVLLDVRQLKIGMFVSELDRKWLGTPFLFQGFRIEKIEEIQKLSKVCQGVYVDIEKSRVNKRIITQAAQQQTPERKKREYILSAAFEDEIVTANEIRQNTENCIEEVFDDVAHGRMIDLVTVRRTVSNTIDGILRNPDAHVCLTQLKEWDNYTAQHSINVSVLAIVFARHLGLPRSEMEILGIGSLLHDIGKLKTPLDVLNKPGKLTEDEFKMMQAHPVNGRHLIEQKYGLSRSIADMAFSHHERIAGGGYPRGLSGPEISSWGKMVAIVDVYDAITSDRCYHQGMSPTDALTKMYEWRVTDFDSTLLEQFIQCIGIYPVGTIVEMNTGEVGLIISVNPLARLKPRVNLILDAEKKLYYPSRIVNLADMVDDESNYTILKVLAPGTYGINVKEYLEPIQKAKVKMIETI